MELEVLTDAERAAARAAEVVAEEARRAVAQRGRFCLAVSGGSTPWRMLEVLSGLELPWWGVHVFQVDERVAPAGDPDRNLTHLRQSLLSRAPLPETQLHAMPVEEADLESAAAAYEGRLAELAGTPPVLDLVHLGLGGDGHTASLLPGDPVLDERRADVSLAGPYQGRRRITLTYPLLERARCILWLVTGAGKAEMLGRLRAGDASIPAGRVARAHARILADRAAAGEPASA